MSDKRFYLTHNGHEIQFRVSETENCVRINYTDDKRKVQPALYLYEFNEGEGLSNISCGIGYSLELGRKVWRHFANHGWIQIHA